VAPDAVVSGVEGESAQGKTQTPVTVREALRRLQASCRNGELFDKTGRQIYFFQLIECWGNPPEDYQERLTLQAKEIERLKQKYTVVEISCAQLDPRQIH